MTITTIEILPDDIFTQISRLSDIDVIGLMGRVKRAWYRITNHNSLWKYLLERDVGLVIDGQRNFKAIYRQIPYKLKRLLAPLKLPCFYSSPEEITCFVKPIGLGIQTIPYLIVFLRNDQQQGRIILHRMEDGLWKAESPLPDSLLDYPSFSLDHRGSLQNKMAGVRVLEAIRWLIQETHPHFKLDGKL